VPKKEKKNKMRKKQNLTVFRKAKEIQVDTRKREKENKVILTKHKFHH